MLYTQQFLIPANGVLRIGTIGGSPYEQNKEGQDIQVGYTIPPRTGLIRIDGVSSEDPRLFDCVANIGGYSNKPILGAKVPGRVIVEFPCSIDVVGPPGVNILIEAWEAFGYADRGACQSVLTPDTGIIVPTWASAFDLSTPGIATFRDSSGAVVGVITGTVVNFSIPSGAATVDVASSQANNPIIFRQQG